MERPLSDACNRVGNLDGSETGTTVKRALSDAGDGATYSERFQRLEINVIVHIAP